MTNDVGDMVKAFSCGTCGARYLSDAWASLVLSQKLEPPEIRRLVREWPDNLVIEVRACGKCSASIAAKCRR
jgi:hypothetical protein